MPKKPCVRTPVGGQDVKGNKTLLKSPWQYFCDIFWSLWEKMSLVNYFLVVSEILKLFVNILTPYKKYSLSATASV